MFVSLKTNLPYTWHKNHKYYKVYLQPNLFGTFSIVCVWGSINNNLGNCRTIICDTKKELELTLKNIFKTRKYRGYS